MRNEHHISYSNDLRNQADKSYRRWMFYGALLMLAHVLDIRPAEVEIFQNKLSIPDPNVIYGGLGLLFLFYFYDACISQYLSGVVSPFRLDRLVVKTVVLRSRKKGRSIKVTKIHARLRYALYVILLLPMILAIMLICLAALCASLHDVWKLGQYILFKSPLIGGIINDA